MGTRKVHNSRRSLVGGPPKYSGPPVRRHVVGSQQRPQRTQRSFEKLVHQPSKTVLWQLDVEVDEQARAAAGKPQAGKQPGFLHRVERLRRLGETRIILLALTLCDGRQGGVRRFDIDQR